MSILYILLAIVLLGVLIMAHEFGHFIAARLCGISVKEFSIGFGPKLLQRKSRKHDTLFTLRPIPLGGYCMFYGDSEEDADGAKKPDPRDMSLAPVWKRIVTVISGPLMNFLLAFIVAVLLMSVFGVSITSPIVASVEDGQPAQLAGLQAGDVFVDINGMSMTDQPVSAASEAIARSAEDAPIDVTVSRDGEEDSFRITPFFDEAERRFRIGIMIQQGVEKLPGGQVIPAAWSTCVEASGAILEALGKLVTTGEGLNETSGPVGVVQLVAQQTQQGGAEIYLYLFVLISINLGLMNLLPIPGLDGSRVIFLIIEGIRRKPINQKIEGVVHMCGYVLLFGLLLFFTFKDVLRLFGV